MSISFIFLTAVALSLDAFAVSVSCGITQGTKRTSDKFRLALFFGLFQGIMPLLSYYLSNIFIPEEWKYSGILAFIIMTAIGIHMIIEYFSKEEECGYGRLTIRRLLFLSFATSIDAFAAGLTFALMKGNIYLAVLGISVITFSLSLTGVYFGCKLGGKMKKSAELVGAVMIILLGIKFLIDSI